MALPGTLAVEEAVTGYTLGDRHWRALRGVVESSRHDDRGVALNTDLLQALRELVGCDHIMFEGVDYLRGSSWFSQGNGYDVDWFSSEVEKGTFWDLVRSGNEVRPWIPDNNASIVTKPTDYMCTKQWRGLPVYVDMLRHGPSTTYELMMNIEDTPGRQLRLLCWRNGGRDFGERERFDLQLLMPHVEAAYRHGQQHRQKSRLTRRQQTLLEWVAGGWTNQQIARRMGLSEGTVRTHLNNIYARLGVSSRTEAVTRVFGIRTRLQ
jgi:DNA-binding CsgD family transcriptional regulator